ncbi:MAG TPA: glycosyltransferase [Opitutaceae bacterium]|nr:glycosyltransferase [Opitutaceae bacterium]
MIPTCNRPDSLAACLERLAPGSQILPAAEYEVIVADDGSESVQDLLRRRFPWARWVAGPRRGPAANRNRGTAAAQGEWIAFTDDDCVPDRGWLAGYATVMASGGKSLPVLEGRTYVDRPRSHPFEFSPVNESGGHLWSCNFAIRRDLFLALAGFDERFPYSAMEDMELRVRLAERGIEPRFVPGAAVLHPWRRIADWRQHAARHLASRLLMESLHPGKGFPVSAWRAFRVHLRVTMTEHVPWLVRHPADLTRELPSMWVTMIEDVWTTWKQRSRGVRNP